MIFCKDCVYWSIDVEEGSFYFGFGGCLCPKFKCGYRISSVEVEEDSVIVENDEGWSFVTGPKFACVHGVLTEELMEPDKGGLNDLQGEASPNNEDTGRKLP